MGWFFGGMTIRILPPWLRALRDDRSGNTLAICAVAIIPLTAVIGSALDLSVAYMTRSRLQNACDAGVLAGRQYMQGTNFSQAVHNEADKFFDFNFPAGTAGSTEIDFTVEQDQEEESQLIGSANALVPTSLMRIFGYKNIPIEVTCDATRDMGHNDVMLVLDVTGSMADAPSNGGGTKIGRLRTGAAGLYRALESDDGSVTRFGIVPYSHTVNVGRSLKNKDILKEQEYFSSSDCGFWGCNYVMKTVHINESSWNIGNGGGNTGGNTQNFRTSGDACIEERPSVGEAMSPFRIGDTVSQADVDTQADNAGNQPELQFGRYDPPQHTHTQTTVSGGVTFYRVGGTWVQTGCPSEAVPLQTYDSESAFQTAINTATARVTGGTYHDVGMLWGVRFLSRTGYFSADNPTERNQIPVNEHIVFMTDGMLDTGETLYSAHGIERYQQRTQGSGSLDDKHISRFNSACNVAKSMGMTVWVIALDVTDTDDVDDCATSADHFYTSDGSDLESVFERIGQGIGNLRLTR